MLFAAGFGTRMGALTANTPKPLVQVAGRALIDHALTEVEAVTLETKVVNCHYFPEQIKAHFRDQDDITIIEEVGEILETGGGLKNALPLLGDGPVFTMNTDAVWSGENPLNALLKGVESCQNGCASCYAFPKRMQLGMRGEEICIWRRTGNSLMARAASIRAFKSSRLPPSTRLNKAHFR